MAVQTPPKSPLSVGVYEIMGRAGTGTSDVFRARDAQGRPVAAYLFPDPGRKSRVLAGLSAAFEAASRLDHPNVLRVLDFGREGAFGYLVTEWVEGATLARLLELHTRLPEANAIRFAAQIGQAMDHARAGDMAPCRVSPSNVLVRSDGRVKVIPFRLPGDHDTVPQIAAAVLKPEFAAAVADDLAGHKPVPFADLVFSLGTILHEVLTGTVWVRPDPPSGKRRRPATRLVGLTERSERAIRRATDPDPAKRPATCADFLKLLRSRPLAAGTPRPDARPDADADNRRGYVRYSLGVGTNARINTWLFDVPADPVSAEVWPLVVQDVSATGIGILLARRCEPGTELSIEVAIDQNRAVRSLPARVVRVRKDNFGHWMHGCAFLAPLQEPELTALLAHLGRTDPV